MDGRIIPDPANGSAIEAKAAFQALSPNGAVVLDVERHRVSLTDYTWTVIYRPNATFPSAKDFECVRAKAIFQQNKPSNAKCKGLTAIERNGQWLWTIDYALVPTRTLGDYLTSCFTCCTTRTTSGIPSKELKKLRPNMCSVLITRKDKDTTVSLDEVGDSDLPKKLLYKGYNVTRKFFSRTRLSKADIPTLLRQRNIPQKYFKKFVPPENRNTNHREGAALSQPDDLAEEACESTSPPVLPKARPSATIPFDYSTEDQRYQKSKFNDYNTMMMTIDHLHMSQFRVRPVRQLTNAGKKRSLFCKLQLTACGLPTDESLFDLFLSFCTDRGISSDAVTAVIRDSDRATPLIDNR